MRTTVAEPLSCAICDLPQVRTILFVCTGNTCRSPMAAAVWNDLAKEKQPLSVACSAGLYAADGMPISKNAVEALAAAGIAATPQNDYPAHTARSITAEMMQNADRVIAITASHAMELVLRFPQYAAKIETMPRDIADPFGGDLARYSACLAEIREAVATLFAGEAEA